MKLKQNLRLTFLFLSVILITFSGCQTNVGKIAETKNPNGRNDAWGHVGPGGGGAQFNPAVSPHDPNFVFVTCDMGGSYVSYNGGESWRMFNLRRMCQFFAFDPVNPDVVYACSSVLYKSTDRGNTWTLFYPKPSEGDGSRFNARRTVQALAIDPARSEKMYAAIRTDQTVVLFVSDNGGEDWIKERELAKDVKGIFIDPSSPAGNRTIYVTMENGIEQKVNGQWKSNLQKEGELKFNSFTSGYDEKIKKYIIYAISGENYYTSRDRVKTTQTGIYYTEDGGKTWENRQEGLVKLAGTNPVPPEYRAIGTSAFHPEVVYVSYTGFKFHPDTTFHGVAKSEDFGKTWTLPWKDMGRIPSPNFGRDWMNERFSTAWGENPFSVAVAPTNPDVFYGSDFGRTIKTANGGKTWEGVYSKLQPNGKWASRGMEVTTNHQVVFDPFDENHVFLAVTDIGLFESNDGAKSWLSATENNGVPQRWYNTTYWLTFDPEVKGRGWAVMSGIHDLPHAKMFRNGLNGYNGDRKSTRLNSSH